MLDLFSFVLLDRKILLGNLMMWRPVHKFFINEFGLFDFFSGQEAPTWQPDAWAEACPLQLFHVYFIMVGLMFSFLGRKIQLGNLMARRRPSVSSVFGNGWFDVLFSW